jgi:hypothetical protein
MKRVNPVDLTKISPERQRIARVFKTYIEKAIVELGSDYDVTLRGEFAETPICIEIEITSHDEIP